MSFERPTRRELINLLALARGGPYELRCVRYAEKRIYRDIQFDMMWRVTRHGVQVVRWFADSPMSRWLKEFV